MSYNLMAEGDLDLFDLAEKTFDFAPLEVFPIPGEGSGAARVPDALGIAVATSRRGPDAVDALHALIELMWSKGASVYDLYTGTRIANETDIAAMATRVGG